jgi:tetratricopeptide (TPR) repeat protein
MRQLLTLTAILGVLAGCASGGGGIRISQPVEATPSLPPSSSASVQALYESGRDSEVVSRAAAPSVPSDDVWFGAQSLLRVGQRGEAVEQFRRLRDTAQSDAFRRAAEVALARLSEQPDALQIAQDAAAAFPSDPFVQFEAGIMFSFQGDAAQAALAFDAALTASPTLAYAHYHAGLNYSRADRPDMTVTRFETFIRLAPSAPERPQVESILRTARGR